MTALTGPIETNRQDGEMLAYPMGASTTIYKGSLCVTRGDGYAYPLRAPATSQPDVFIGIADETVANVSGSFPSYIDGDEVTGSAGSVYIRIRKKGVYTLAKATAALTDVGTEFYGADDATVSATSTNAVAVGTAVGVVDTGHLRIRIDLATV